MTYNATVINVMIASPQDVPEECRVVREVIYQWNAVSAEKEKKVLMPIDWKTNTAPEMGRRPQDIINDQLVEACDLLIGLFWTRIGTPTGKAISGTVEEIREHLGRKRPAMIYFFSKVLKPGSYDVQQFEALMQFKEECRESGIVWEFDSTEDFREKFLMQLQITVNNKFRASSGDEPVRSEPPVTEQVQISADAAELLLEANEDNSGIIMSMPYLGGHSVQTNARNFIEGSDPRTVARWRGAVEELELLGLIEDRNGKGEVFYITNQGYQVADQLTSEK